jgi:hypothetical protein
MAIQINNTTVIDDSRNIANVGIITASDKFIGNFEGNLNSSGISSISSLIASNINAAGVTTIGALFVSGNASIGGTVTYMDVTNVDSVGIITAQQGIQVLANGISVVGVSTFNGNLIFNQFANEKVNIVAGTANGNTNIDLITNGSVHYFTSNSSATWTPNFRASSTVTLDSAMSTGQVITATVISTQNNASFYASAVNVDGTSRTIYWSGGTAPTSGSSSGVDMYTYSIVKTASNTFTVFASTTQYA